MNLNSLEINIDHFPSMSSPNFRLSGGSLGHWTTFNNFKRYCTLPYCGIQWFAETDTCYICFFDNHVRRFSICCFGANHMYENYPNHLAVAGDYIKITMNSSNINCLCRVCTQVCFLKSYQFSHIYTYIYIYNYSKLTTANGSERNNYCCFFPNNYASLSRAK